MPEPALISVVMVVEQGDAARLPRALASLDAQTCQDFDLIIIANGAEDATWRLLSGLERPRTRLHRFAEPVVRPVALNRALAWASGQVVAFQDAAGVSAPERFERQVAVFERRDEVVLTSSHIAWHDSEGRRLRTFEPPTQHKAILNTIEEHGIPVPGAAMVSRAALDAAGGFREVFHLAADLDLWMRLAGHGKLATVPDVLTTLTITPSLPRIARQDEYAAYAALAGADTDPTPQAEAIRARKEAQDRSEQRKQRAKNFLNAAEDFAAWGGAAEDFSRQLWWAAFRAWSLHRDVWRAAGERLGLVGGTEEKT